MFLHRARHGSCGFSSPDNDRFSRRRSWKKGRQATSRIRRRDCGVKRRAQQFRGAPVVSHWLHSSCVPETRAVPVSRDQKNAHVSFPGIFCLAFVRGFAAAALDLQPLNCGKPL